MSSLVDAVEESYIQEDTVRRVAPSIGVLRSSDYVQHASNYEGYHWIQVTWIQIGLDDFIYTDSRRNQSTEDGLDYGINITG